jgi:glycosyltransferase involved in cell wall biosynthesis
MDMIKLLVFTTLFPNERQPRHGIFVETRLRHLLAGGKVQAVVVAPVPWFPFKTPGLSRYSMYADIPRKENRYGLEVHHPRYLVIPKIGFLLTPFFLALSSFRCVRGLVRSGLQYDLIDAHYFYPDGVAATLLGKWVGKPHVITARGSDLNLIPQYNLPRRMIQWSAKYASGIITVCQTLKDVLIRLNVPDEKITVLRNGVNLELFHPSEERDSLREKLGINGTSIISVGNFVKLKGHHLIIEAMKQCPGCTLYIVGDGEEYANLKYLVESLELNDRVIFLGELQQEQLRSYYAAIDILVLASSREGWANVLLESMACGTPVVATRVGGTPEVVSEPEAGLLVERTVDEIATGLRQLYTDYPDRGATRQYAERFDWGATSRGQEALFAAILRKEKVTL